MWKKQSPLQAQLIVARTDI